MTDAERSIQSCLAAFAEYQRMLKHSVRHRHEAKIRIAVQIAGGRVLNTQLSSNIDFKPETAEITANLEDREVELAVMSANQWFTEWHEELTSSITKRLNGWLRLMIAVSDGSVSSGNSNPSFDMKPT